VAGGAALWPSAAFGAPGEAEPGRAEVGSRDPFAMPERELDRGRLLGEVRAVVAQQVQEAGAPAGYARRIGPIAERVDFQAPFEFLVVSYFEREPDRRDALLALHARDPRQAIRELGPAFPSPRGEMILSTFAYYDVSADRIRVNIARLPANEAARVLVHEFWHALPDLRSWNGGDGTAYRATGFLTQRRQPGLAVWEPFEEKNGVPYSAYLLNEAMATRMEVRYAGPTRFDRPDLVGVDSFLNRLSEAAGSGEVMRAYLESQPGELSELAGRHRAALPELETAVRR
ncbi:MAG: hypothetical protein M3O34_05810, partial [Chloroflexota bacterium]|nr:hypothetical protein [Chloroflexota bacterium]